MSFDTSPASFRWEQEPASVLEPVPPIHLPDVTPRPFLPGFLPHDHPLGMDRATLGPRRRVMLAVNYIYTCAHGLPVGARHRATLAAEAEEAEEDFLPSIAHATRLRIAERMPAHPLSARPAATARSPERPPYEPHQPQVWLPSYTHV